MTMLLCIHVSCCINCAEKSIACLSGGVRDLTYEWQEPLICNFQAYQLPPPQASLPCRTPKFAIYWFIQCQHLATLESPDRWILTNVPHAHQAIILMACWRPVSCAVRYELLIWKSTHLVREKRLSKALTSWYAFFVVLLMISRDGMNGLKDFKQVALEIAAARKEHCILLW
jgi:hypothetical protein